MQRKYSKIALELKMRINLIIKRIKMKSKDFNKSAIISSIVRIEDTIQSTRSDFTEEAEEFEGVPPETIKISKMDKHLQMLRELNSKRKKIIASINKIKRNNIGNKI